jgi:hypothetical protein
MRRARAAVQPAVEWNIGRTATVMAAAPPDLFRPGLMPSSLAMRVACVLTGVWLGRDSRCLPRLHGHLQACWHRDAVPFIWREVARSVYGPTGGGGRQLDLIRAAMIELAETSYVLWQGRGAYFFERWSHILSWQDVRTDHASSPEFHWDPFVLQSLMDGHFQEFPANLLRLPRTAFIFWLVAISQVGSGTKRVSRIPVTGIEASYFLEQIGVSLRRADRLEPSLRSYADQGNAVQDEFLIVIERRSGSGLNIVVENRRIAAVRARRPKAVETRDQPYVDFRDLPNDDIPWE